MSSPDSRVLYEALSVEDAPASVRRRRSTACLPSRPRPGPSAINPAAIRAPRHSSCPSAIMTPSSPRRERVAGRLAREPDTDFKYVGSIEEFGWKQGQIPLFLEWFPEKLDRRSVLKFFESGREYIIGRAPNCDIYFQNAEPDSGISSQHLKIKTELVPGHVNRIYVTITDLSTNGTYINNEKIGQGNTRQIAPDDHITILKRDNASDSRPNIGFRVVMALQKPKIEDHYELFGTVLGSGTFGAVHKAQHIKSKRTVAVKIIRSLRGSTLSQDLEREIRIMKKLDHPNIVQYRDSFEDNKDQQITRYIVMEFVEGGTLHEYIQISDMLSEDTVRHIICQMLSALEYMHEYVRVSHRDLKPANILLCSQGALPTIKLADLGLAKIEAASKNNTFCGSPGYLAPECTRGPQAAGLNWTMDIYAIGVITYELLTGKRPFGTDMTKDPYTRKLPMLPLQTRRASAEVIDFMIRLLSFDPTERPPARDCLLHPWFSSTSVSTSVSTQILPPVEITASPKTVRATPRLQSPETDSSDDSFRSPSPPASSSSSSESEEESTIKPSLSNSKVSRANASFFSEPMDICTMRSEKMSPREAQKETFVRTASPMNVDTMRPADKVWCILHPLPGNAAGSTSLFLTKANTIVGSDTKADIVIRHPNIRDHHCTIVAGTWNKTVGLTGTLHVQDEKTDTSMQWSLLRGTILTADYIGYQVEIPGQEDFGMTRGMSCLNIDETKKRAAQHFSPYSPSWRRRCTGPSSVRRSLIKTTPNLKTTVEGGSLEGEEIHCPGQAWGELVSLTSGYPNIFLYLKSTNLGRILDFRDMYTGEQLRQYQCRVYRTRNGQVGVRAVRPVLIDGNCIDQGQKMTIQNNQTLSLCEEDMKILVEYELHIYV